VKFRENLVQKCQNRQSFASSRRIVTSHFPSLKEMDWGQCLVCYDNNQPTTTSSNCFYIVQLSQVRTGGERGCWGRVMYHHSTFSMVPIRLFIKFWPGTSLPSLSAPDHSCTWPILVELRYKQDILSVADVYFFFFQIFNWNTKKPLIARHAFSASARQSWGSWCGCLICQRRSRKDFWRSSGNR